MKRRGDLGNGSTTVVLQTEEVIRLAGSQSLAMALICRCKLRERSFSKAGRTTLRIVLRNRDIVDVVAA